MHSESPESRWPYFAALLAALILPLTIAACGSSGGGPVAEPEVPGESQPGPETAPPPEPESPACDQEFSSTYQAVQELVWDKHCIGCHAGDGASGGLDLSPGVSHANLFQQPSQSSDLLLVRAGSRWDSELWKKLSGWTDDSVQLSGGSFMPPSGSLSAKELDVVRFWISAGAMGPDEGVVQGTADIIAGCFPDAVPTQILPLEVPAPGDGVQIKMPSYTLPAASELEVCFCSYADLNDEIPDEFKTPDGKFFFYDQSEIRQTGASHHLLIQAPNDRLVGESFDPSVFTAWSCVGGANEGLSCDPKGNDCGNGVCVTPLETTTACGGYGPGNGTITRSFVGTQQPQAKTTLYPGVYRTAPTETVVCWNSHAFNLTTQNFEMNARLNFRFAKDRVYRSRGLNTSGTFAIPELIANGAPAYTKETMCWERTLPQYARVTSFNSHNHKRGERAWWTMPDGETVIYENLVYNDPPDIFFADPLKFDSPNPEDRTLRFCITYNNGVDDDGNPDPSTVTRSSLIPYGLGGPNSTGSVGLCEPYACVNEGADFTINCDDDTRNQAGDDALCDTTPGAGDGFCDACSIMGGVTTENEMGRGSIQYFVVEGED